MSHLVLVVEDDAHTRQYITEALRREGSYRVTGAASLQQGFEALGREQPDVLGVRRNTVASHVKGIYLKLEVSSRGEAVFEALSQGLVKLRPPS